MTEVRLNTRYYTLTVAKNQLIQWTDYHIKDVAVELEAPTSWPPGTP